MFSSADGPVGHLQWTAQYLDWSRSHYSESLQPLIVLLTLWICWRLWKFTLVPRIYPNDPKELPYCFPLLGHGIAFFKHSPALLQRAYEHFNGDKAPYSLTLFGTTIYVVTDPKHVAEVHKNTQNLTFEEFIITILQQSGMSESGIKTVYKPLPKDKSGFPNPNGEAMVMLVRHINIHQGYPGSNLDDLDSRFTRWYESRFRLPSLEGICAQHLSKDERTGSASLRVPLWQFCSEIQVKAAGDVYFGDALGQVEPDYASTFLEFDDLCWQILYQYPSFLTKKLTGLMRRMQGALERYIAIPQEQRQAVAQINIEENELRALGVSEHDMSILFFNIFWGVNTNSRKTAFWILNYLLHNPQQIDLVRQEIEPAFQGDSLVDPSHLFEKSPNLEAIWHETLRMYSHATSARAIKQDTIIGGRLLRKGHRIMMPNRPLHFDKQVWGPDADTFHPERFSGKGSDLTKSASWRPFGGGKSLCTGRYVARHMSFMFVAILLRRFDVAMIGKPKFPKGDIGKPVLGMMSIKDDEDYLVEIKERASVEI